MRFAICGAGIAGPTLAYWLVRSGHEVTLIEKEPRFRTGGYVIDFWGVGYTVAEKMGVLPEILKAGYSVREVRFLGDRGRKVGGFSNDVFFRLTDNRFTSLPRGDLAEIIYHHLKHNVEMLFDTSISDIEERADCARVTLTQGEVREFDFVVGADGLHSAVRRLTFGPQAAFERQLGYYVAAFEAQDYGPRDELAYIAYAAPGRQIGRFALRGGRTLFLFVFRRNLLNDGDPTGRDGVRNALHQVFDGAGWETTQIFEAMDGVREIYFDRVSQIRMDRWFKGRVILIGDAAAAVSLLAGEGTGLAMTQAYVLAGELGRAQGSFRRAFQNYEKKLRPFILAKQKAAENFANSFVPSTRLGIWTRNQATKLMRFPGVAKMLIGSSVRDDFELPEYDFQPKR